MTLPRGLESAVRDALARMPVVILEGSRAVGKTTLCLRLQEQGAVGSFVPLDDPTVLQAVVADPAGYLDGLQPPVVIDEAQLFPEVTLYVKRIVDRADSAARFLLTGSARLDRGQLGGSDPLAGRSTALVLRPFTRAELQEPPPGSQTAPYCGLIAVTAEGLQPHGALPALPRDDLIGRLRRGGFPRWALGTTPGSADLAQYVDSVLHEESSGARFDRSALQRLFRSLAERTGNIVNVSNLANDLALSRPTINSHLDRLERAHLIERLYGFRGSTAGENRTNPKIHAVDSSFAFWSTSSTAREVDQSVLGAALETHAVNEIRAQAAWCGWDAQANYWRDNATKLEVDLVLSDDDGQRFGFEIKAATTVSEHDLRGLRLLRRQRGLARGFVVYTGTELFELDDGLWALPITALWTPLAQVRAPVAAPPSVALVVSYTQADNRTEGGRILQFADDLADRYEFETGEPLSIFTDHPDAGGRRWRERRDADPEAATFFAPIVTPRYLRSEGGRTEIRQFVATTENLGSADRYLLPVLWRTPPNWANETDAVAATLRAHQPVDVHDAVTAGPDSATYRDILSQLAQQLIERIRRAETQR